MLEFLLAVVCGLLPLCAGLFELAQLGVSRQLLQLAAFEGVRAAAVSAADVNALRIELARGLVPLFGSERSPAAARAAYRRALLEVGRPDLMQIKVLSPVPGDFAEFGVVVDGDRVIPNEAQSPAAAQRTAVGRSLLDANRLEVEVRYCRRLLIPLLDRLIVATRRLVAGPLEQVCLAQRRVPIVVRVATMMQSHASARRIGTGG